MNKVDIDKLIDGYYESDVHHFYKKHGEGLASHYAKHRLFAKTPEFRKIMRVDEGIGGKKGAITKKINGFDFRGASLRAAEVMKNMSSEMRKEYGERAKKIHTGLKRSDEVRKNISDACIGRPSHMKGKTFSESAKKNMSEGSKGKKLSQEHKDKTRKWMLENNPFKGKKHTEEVKKVMMDKHPSKIKKVCEHCNRELDLPNYKRYHGDKCTIITGRSNVSEEQKNKTKEKLQGRTFGKSVSCFLYPSMVHYKDYPNLTDAIKELDLDRESARLTCVGKRNSVGDFTFRYKL
jgi:hypothetical protein